SPFAYGMDQDTENKTIKLTKLPFVDIKAEPLKPESLLSCLSIKDSDDSQFRKLTAGEAKQTAEMLIQAYDVLVENQKTTAIPLIKVSGQEEGAVKFKEAE